MLAILLLVTIAVSILNLAVPESSPWHLSTTR